MFFYSTLQGVHKRIINSSSFVSRLGRLRVLCLQPVTPLKARASVGTPARRLGHRGAPAGPTRAARLQPRAFEAQQCGSRHMVAFAVFHLQDVRQVSRHARPPSFARGEEPRGQRACQRRPPAGDAAEGRDSTHAGCATTALFVNFKNVQHRLVRLSREEAADGAVPCAGQRRS